ncbi:MAG TPA: CopD family protein, partial [Pseudonocardiaceae bacterium]
VVALLGLLPGPLTGHAASAPAHAVAVVSVAVHAAAAAAWVGGLGVLLTLAATRRTLLAYALPRFSPVAAAALAAVAVSGVVTAAARLGSVDALLDTGYGRVVLAKAAVLAVLGALGALVRRRVLPAVRTHRAAPLALLGTELTLMAVALGLAAALTGTPA